MKNIENVLITFVTSHVLKNYTTYHKHGLLQLNFKFYFLTLSKFINEISFDTSKYMQIHLPYSINRCNLQLLSFNGVIFILNNP